MTKGKKPIICVPAGFCDTFLMCEACRQGQTERDVVRCLGKMFQAIPRHCNPQASKKIEKAPGYVLTMGVVLSIMAYH